MEKRKEARRMLQLEKPLKVNGYDIDVMGVVHNVVYVRWFEDLRTHFLDTYLPLPDLVRDGTCPFLAKTRVEYLRPLEISHEPVGRVWMESIGKVKWEAGFEIFTDEGLHCRGHQTGGFFDLEKRRATVIPQPFRDLFRDAE